MAKKAKVELPIVPFESLHAWEQWLSPNGATSAGIWMKLAKKDSGIATISRQESIDGALCHGWIDGQIRKFDDRHWLVRYTPRGAKSIWSEINRTRAEQLIAAGQMRPAGLNQIERAKADGRWQAAYPPQSTAAVPADLQAALDANPAAREFFLKLTGVNRYAILHRIHNTKAAATRAAKISRFIDMLARSETLHPTATRPAIKPSARKAAKSKDTSQAASKGKK